MGRNKRDRADEWVGDDGRQSAKSRQMNNKNKPEVIDDVSGHNHRSDTNTDESAENDDTPEVQSAVDFDPYFEVVNDFKAQLKAVNKALKRVDSFYSKQKEDIRSAAETKEKLKDMTSKYRRLVVTVESLEDVGKAKAAKVELQLAEATKKRIEMEKTKGKADERQKKLEDDKKSFDKRVKDYEAERIMKVEMQQREFAEAQNAKLAEIEKAQGERLAELEIGQAEEHKERMENLEREFKKRQNESEKFLSDLQTKHEKLRAEFTEQGGKLTDVERKCRLAERLNHVSDGEMEALKRHLRRAENEFELNTHSNEYYQKEFLKIENTSRAIAERNVKELNIGDLDTVHGELEQLDSSLESVPISGSDVSVKLCIAHVQRIISTQLREIIWQPFSSDIILREPGNLLLLNRISNQLATSSHGSSSGPRAARLHAALTMRACQSHSPSAAKRVNLFTVKVMAILSLLVEDSLHSSLRSDLNDLAISAADLWSSIQTDEREFIVEAALDSANYEGWHGDMLPPNEVIVLFPRITARKHPCPWSTNKSSHSSMPGEYVEDEPELHFEETTIHEGTGMPEWSDLVAEGYDEEEERKSERDRLEAEEQRRELEEKLKKKQNESTRHKRRISQGRRDSFSPSSPSSPIAMWTTGLVISEAAT